jgi:hypothetical protein
MGRDPLIISGPFPLAVVSGSSSELVLLLLASSPGSIRRRGGALRLGGGAGARGVRGVDGAVEHMSRVLIDGGVPGMDLRKSTRG